MLPLHGKGKGLTKCLVSSSIFRGLRAKYVANPWSHDVGPGATESFCWVGLSHNLKEIQLMIIFNQKSLRKLWEDCTASSGQWVGTRSSRNGGCLPHMHGKGEASGPGLSYG